MPAHHLALGPPPAPLDRLQDPEEGHPELAQQRRQRRRGLARLKMVQVGVIGFGGVAQGLGLLPLQGDDRDQEGLEGLPVARRPGPLPGRFPFGGGLGQGHGQVLGNLDGPVVIPPPLPDVHRGRRPRVRHQVRGLHPGQGLPHPGVGGPDVNPLGQHGELVVAVRMPFGGDVGALVPAQHAGPWISSRRSLSCAPPAIGRRHRGS